MRTKLHSHKVSDDDNADNGDSEDDNVDHDDGDGLSVSIAEMIT